MNWPIQMPRDIWRGFDQQAYSVLEMKALLPEPSVPYSLGVGYGCSHGLGLTDILNVSQVPLMDVLERAHVTESRM